MPIPGTKRTERLDENIGASEVGSALARCRGALLRRDSPLPTPHRIGPSAALVAETWNSEGLDLIVAAVPEAAEQVADVDLTPLKSQHLNSATPPTF